MFHVESHALIGRTNSSRNPGILNMLDDNTVTSIGFEAFGMQIILKRRRY